MADHADDNNNNNIFVYTGGAVPEHLREHITHACIDESVTVIDAWAFYNCQNLLNVDMHDGISRIRSYAFHLCNSLKHIKLPGVITIEQKAFAHTGLTDVEFGDKLEVIGEGAFDCCCNMTRIKIPSVIRIEKDAFNCCMKLMDVEFGERLKAVGEGAFWSCDCLTHITIPLLEWNQLNETAFNGCKGLATADLIGGIHKTISCLHLESWRNEMTKNINRINQDLPDVSNDPAVWWYKTDKIKQWFGTVKYMIEHFKAEHYQLLNEATTLLELAIWKAKLDEIDEEDSHESKAKKARIDNESARNEKRITSGADIVIKNVLPFLILSNV